MLRYPARVVGCALAAAILCSCGTPGIPLPPSLELPKPVTDLRAVRKGDNVYLAWTAPSKTTDGKSIRHLGPTNICRNIDGPITKCGTPVGQIPPMSIAAAMPTKGKSPKGKNSEPKVRVNYLDKLIPAALTNPTGEITYAVEALNEDGRGDGISNQAQVPSSPTLPPPTGFRASVTAEGIVLSWDAVARPSSLPELQFRYRVYRREEGSTADTVVGELPLNLSSSPRLIDRNFEWEKTYEYRANVITAITQPDKPEIEVEGDDTLPIKVFAHDVFPPAVPSGLQAVFSGEGQQPFIDLIWAPNTEPDLAGYNVYRREENGQAVKVNSELVKTPAYRDSNVQSAKKYFYSVSAVDVRGNESARSEEANEVVP
jgi:hypothetical protein